jgi:hypothetical protein
MCVGVLVPTAFFHQTIKQNFSSAVVVRLTNKNE